jgi:nucleotide-binding universal stress UspA family protein
VPLGLNDWMLMVPFFLASPVAMELLKAYFRRAKEAAGGAAATAGIPVNRPQTGGKAMKVLVPVDVSHNSEGAVRHVVRRFMNDKQMEIHLLNVQPQFTHYVTHKAGSHAVHEYHHEQSEKALQPSMRILDGFGIPYVVHMKIGDAAEQITELAKRLHCDEIVMGTARKNSLTRLVESSLTNRVLELTSVPVEVIAGDAISPWERYGIPAAIAALVALVFAAVD